MCVCLCACVCVCVFSQPLLPPPRTDMVAPHMQVCWSMIDLGRGSGHILNWSWFPLLPTYRPGVYHRLSVMFVCFHRSALLREAVGGWWEEVGIGSEGRKRKGRKKKKKRVWNQRGFPLAVFPSSRHKSPGRRSGCNYSGKVLINWPRLNSFSSKQLIYIRCCYWWTSRCGVCFRSAYLVQQAGKRRQDELS